MTDDLSGLSREISTAPAAAVISSHFYSLGVLFAYCYVFGIRDLHRNNIVKTETHLQVIDAEVVLSKLLLPHETLLLPFKEVSADLCGAAHAEWERATSFDVKLVFDGYLDTFECLLANQLPLLNTFSANMSELLSVPVRHILRDTFHYRDWLTKDSEIPFFPAEQRQLGRGDIPYFFKFIGCDDVFEIVSPEGAFEKVELPEVFLKGAAREASMPAELLSPTRLSELLPTGALFVAKKLTARNWTGSIEGSDFKIELSDSSIAATFPHGSYSSRR